MASRRRIALHVTVTSLVKDFGLGDKDSDETLAKFLSKSEVLEAWLEFYNSSRHLRNHSGPYERLCRQALEAFSSTEDPPKPWDSPEDKATWTMAQHKLRFLARFMWFMTQPGEKWAGEKITYEHFCKAIDVLRFVSHDMTMASYKRSPETHKAIEEALKDKGLTLSKPLPLKYNLILSGASSSNSNAEVANSLETLGDDESYTGEQSMEDAPVEQGEISETPLPARSATTASLEDPSASIKREMTSPIIDLTGDSDDEPIKYEQDEMMTEAGEGNGGDAGSEASDEDVWWPGKLAITKHASSPVDSDMWWPGKMENLFKS
jgi:hypothetical protein